MKAIIINEYGGPEKLIYTDVPDPVPGKREVLVKIAAASVNPVDWKVREGRLKFLSGKKMPLGQGAECSGIIEKTGDGVKGLKVGDRVFAGLSHKGGAYAEKVAVSEKKVTKLPDDFPLDIASTLAIAGVTPLQAFTIHYPVKKGDDVLINGGSGGIGTFAIQIAKILGANVTAVCSEKNIELVRNLGADEVIDYTKENYLDRAEAFDCIVDAAANALFPEARSCLKKGGMLIKLNMSVKVIFQSLLTRLVSSKRIKMILVKNRPDDLHWMIDKIQKGEIKVIVDRKYPLKEARQAQEYSQSGRARGKIILEI